MADIIEWPSCLLRPTQVSPSLVPFSRSGGRSIGGVERSTRTDRGYWSIEYNGIVMQAKHRDQWRAWNAIRTHLGGKTGLIAVRVPSSLSAPYVSGSFEPRVSELNDDGTPFDDGSEWQQGAISVVADTLTPIGSTIIKLRIVKAAADLAGVRFSYNHALYETGGAIEIDGDIWTVPLSTSVREIIPPGAELEFDAPTCLCRLADDRGMDITQDAVAKGTRPNITFVEATDYWNDLALGLI
ncbi:UNVERIFIED_ORG: hypothetical protein GGD59_002235 [Rhizobium esperanzae]